MDFIPFDSSLVRGSHGRLPDKPEQGPLLITTDKKNPLPEHMAPTAVKDYLLNLVFGS
jgi:hypothetical protein